MDAFELTQLLDQRSRTQRAYLEFLRVPSLSAGLYVLLARPWQSRMGLVRR